MRALYMGETFGVWPLCPRGFYGSECLHVIGVAGYFGNVWDWAVDRHYSTRNDKGTVVQPQKAEQSPGMSMCWLGYAEHQGT